MKAKEPEWFLKYKQCIAGDLNLAQCYVYVITDGIFVKIGVANDVQKRLEQLQVGNPKPLTMLKCYAFRNRTEAYRCETKLHSKYDDYRTLGEWFLLPPVMLNELGSNDDIAIGCMRYCSNSIFRKCKSKKKKRIDKVI